MAKGGFHEPFFAVAWPIGEFGGMGLEGAVKAGFRKELEAVKDPQEREALYEKLVALAYERGKAINMASLNPARVLGLGDKFGSIATGKYANFVVLDREFRVVDTILRGKSVKSRIP